MRRIRIVQSLVKMNYIDSKHFEIIFFICWVVSIGWKK